MATGLGQRPRRMRVRYRADDGAVVDTALDRLTVDEVVDGLPIREFRWRKGQRHYCYAGFSGTGRRPSSGWWPRMGRRRANRWLDE